MTIRIGTVIRERREAIGLTQEILAGKIGKSSGYIGQVEREEIYPSALMLAQLVDILGIDANLFFSSYPQNQYVSQEIAIRAARLDPEKQEFLLGIISLLEQNFKKEESNEGSNL